MLDITQKCDALVVYVILALMFGNMILEDSSLVSELFGRLAIELAQKLTLYFFNRKEDDNGKYSRSIRSPEDD